MRCSVRLQDYSFSFGMHCDGIMGLEVVKNNITEINFEKQKFIFYPNTFDITTRRPDNKKTFLVKMLPVEANSIQLAVNTGDGHSLTMALDTGNSFYATTHRDSLERVGLSRRVARIRALPAFSGVASGTVVSWDKKMTNMKIFGVPVPLSTWDVIDLPSSDARRQTEPSGSEFLKNFNIIIDYNRRRVWFENWTRAKLIMTRRGELGMAAIYDNVNKKVVIANVSPEARLVLRGIKQGDELLSIDLLTDLSGGDQLQEAPENASRSGGIKGQNRGLARWRAEAIRTRAQTAGQRLARYIGRDEAADRFVKHRLSEPSCKRFLVGSGWYEATIRVPLARV